MGTCVLDDNDLMWHRSEEKKHKSVLAVRYVVPERIPIVHPMDRQQETAKQHFPCYAMSFSSYDDFEMRESACSVDIV